MRWKSFCFHWWRGIGSRTLMIFKHYLCTTLISESFHCNAILINSLIISPSLYILVKLITWNSFSYFLLLYSFHIIYQYHKIDTSVIYEDIKAHKLCCSLLDYFHQKYELHWSMHKWMIKMIKMITIQKSWYLRYLMTAIYDRPKELLVRSPNKSTNWFELIHLPHNFVKKFLSVTNKSKFLSTLRSITIIWLRWNIHDVLLPFVFVLTFFRASSAKEKHVASAFLQSTKPKLSQLFDIFDTKATKKTETTISTSACRFSTRKTYA